MCDLNSIFKIFSNISTHTLIDWMEMRSNSQNLFFLFLCNCISENLVLWLENVSLDWRYGGSLWLSAKWRWDSCLWCVSFIFPHRHFLLVSIAKERDCGLGVGMVEEVGFLQDTALYLTWVKNDREKMWENADDFLILSLSFAV